MTLEQARQAVARDLADPSYASVLGAALEHRRWWVEQWAEGEPFLTCLLAQDVQEAVQAREPLWPPCSEPSCPQVGRHPLVVEPDLGTDPFWLCERTGLPVAAVGSLRP